LRENTLKMEIYASSCKNNSYYYYNNNNNKRESFSENCPMMMVMTFAWGMGGPRNEHILCLNLNTRHILID